MKVAAVLVAFGAAAGVCGAQETHFSETHRVTLRNGNLMDGILRETTEQGILFVYSPTARIFIKWGDIRSVEEIKIRTLKSESKKILPPSGERADPEGDRKTPDPTPKDPTPPANLKLPKISPELQQKIDDLLDRLRGTPRFSRGRYATMLDSLGTEARQYMAVRIETLADDLVRWVASEIGRSQDRSIIPELRKRLHSERPVVRSVAVQLLQELKDLDSRPHVERLLRDPDEGVRGAAVVAMPDLGDESSVHALVQLTRDTSSSIRKIALRSVTELARRKGRLPEVVTYWRGNFSSLNASQREDVAEAAGSLIPSLGGDGDETVNAARAEAEEILMELSRDLEGPVRGAAYRALGKLPGQSVREALVKALPGETHDEAAIAIMSTLQQLNDRTAIPELIERLGHSSDRVRDAAWTALKTITGELAMPADQGEWRAWHERQ